MRRSRERRAGRRAGAVERHQKERVAGVLLASDGPRLGETGMIRRLVLVLAAGLALSGCATESSDPPPPPPAPAPPAPPPEPADQCGAAEAQRFIGRHRSEIPVPVNPGLQRVACTTCRDRTRGPLRLTGSVVPAPAQPPPDARERGRRDDGQSHQQIDHLQPVGHRLMPQGHARRSLRPAPPAAAQARSASGSGRPCPRRDTPVRGGPSHWP